MEKFKYLKGIAAPLDMINVDTDMIIPKQFLKTVTREGLGIHAFEELRYDENGNENPDFVLNREPYRKAQILIAGENFGCGSSREHAPWALKDFGIRCIIAPSFADIFYGNCFNNGMLPVILPEELVDRLMRFAEDNPDPVLEVDLPSQEIRGYGNAPIHFDIDDVRKEQLLEGLDDIGITMRSESNAITAYEARQVQEYPWLSVDG